MKRLTDDSVFASFVMSFACLSVRKEYKKKLVSAGGATVEHGTEGTARNGTATPKKETAHQVTIIKFQSMYPKTTQEILDFSSIDDVWVGSLMKSLTFTEAQKSG